MSGPVTEIAIVPIKDGYSVESGEGKTIWDVTLKTISEQKGFKRGSWGVQIENPDVAQMAIDWESLDAHKAFIASDAYGPFMERLKPLFGGTPHLYHVKIPVSSATSPFDAPVTECIALYFDQAFDEAAYEQSFSNFATEAGKVQGSGASGLVGGWSVETHKFDGEGNDKKFFGAFIGWPSVESHMEFRKNEAFPGVVAHLREGVDKVKVHHVAFKPFKA